MGLWNDMRVSKCRDNWRDSSPHLPSITQHQKQQVHYMFNHFCSMTVGWAVLLLLLHHYQHTEGNLFRLGLCVKGGRCSEWSSVHIKGPSFSLALCMIAVIISVLTVLSAAAGWKAIRGSCPSGARVQVALGTSSREGASGSQCQCLDPRPVGLGQKTSWLFSRGKSWNLCMI